LKKKLKEVKKGESLSAGRGIENVRKHERSISLPWRKGGSSRKTKVRQANNDNYPNSLRKEKANRRFSTGSRVRRKNWQNLGGGGMGIADVQIIVCHLREVHVGAAVRFEGRKAKNGRPRKKRKGLGFRRFPANLPMERT